MRDGTGAGAGAQEANEDHWTVLERVVGQATQLVTATALEHALEVRNKASGTTVGA